MEPRRYERQMMLKEIGAEGQRKLRDASVLIVGLGGLGSPAALYLTGAGIGRIGLCDPDTVSESNLHRQVLYDTSSLGIAKTEAAHRRLLDLSPEIIFNLHPEGLTQKNAREIIIGYDLVMDCSDNYATRYLIDRVCAEQGKRWVYGAVGELTGQLSLMNGAAEVRYKDLFPDEEYFTSLPKRTLAAFGPVPGTVGSLQAAEAVKAIIGIHSPLDGSLMTIDFLTLNTNLIKLK